MKILEHDKARTAVAQYPALAARVPPSWLEKCGRKSQIVDAHRVYRMLATGGIGWAHEQLEQLEFLIRRLAGRDQDIDRKLDELWWADENRLDSLATELLVADGLFAGGHAPVVEPAIGTSRPEYLIDGLVLMEVKTYCPRKHEHPIARLKYEITHQVDSGCSLTVRELTGSLTANHVSPLVKQLVRVFDRSRSPTPGARCTAIHDGVSITVEAAERYPELTEGSYLTSGGPVVDVPEAVEDFNAWLLDSAKEAADQMKAYGGPKVVVLDVSLCRSITDAMAISPSVREQLRGRVRAKHPSLFPVIAERHAIFGKLMCTPSLERALSFLSSG